MVVIVERILVIMFVLVGILVEFLFGVRYCELCFLYIILFDLYVGYVK